MIRNLMFLFIFLLPFIASTQGEPKSIEQFVSEIDKKIPQVLHDFSIPGAAIAIIEDGEIVLQKGYGFSDVEKGIKVNLKTGFNIGSISKTVAAWGIMKLVEEGKIELDAPAEKYLTRWHLPESEFDSKEVTIRRLLSHTAGLSLHGYPGWSPKDELPTIEESLNGKNNGPGRVEIIMEPGTKYKYSGGGFTILQLIIEEVTGQKFEDYMQAHILNPLGMTNSSYKIDDKIMAASALEYNNYGDLIDFELFTAQAAAGLHTTLEDFTHLALASLYRNKDREKYASILPDNIIQRMTEAVPEADGFFGYGMGYQVDHVMPLILSGHGGDNTGWHAIFRVNPWSNDGFLALTNGGRGSTICYQIYCDWVTWKRGEPLGDWCDVKAPIANKLKNIIDRDGMDNIEATYTDLKKNQPDKYDFSESQLNELGYYYIGKNDLEKASAILKLNVEAFPNAFNVYDSYGEILLELGKKEEAIKNYEKSLELNPNNENGIKMLKRIAKEDLALLDTDSTWGKEIFYFPISFAPELDYEGFEDARFPKGWGKEESEEFWSYAFAWNIKLNAALTKAELQDKMQIYFDGLMKGVNKYKELVVPKTSALIHKRKATDDGTHYEGEVQVYDSFYTKKVMTLHVTIENSYCEKNKKSITLFRFSPKKVGEAIWLKLNKVKLRANVCDF